MAIYEDSFATMYWGPRRGGKSASQSYDDMAALLAGKRVFADSPVSFDFQIDENYRHHYETEPLDYIELMLALDDPILRRKYANSLVSWDEIDKWMFSRNFQSVFSKMGSQFVTFIGKLEMSFTMTAQFLHLVEKNIRLQVDAQCRCVDLSFKYPQLQRGSTIGQSWQDKSGRMTGTEYDYNEEEYQQTFFAKVVWPIYNTKHAPSILESMQKIEIRQEKKVITIGDLDGAKEEANQYRLNQNQQNGDVVNLLADEIRTLRASEIKTEFSRQELNIMARERGFKGSDYLLFNHLTNEGVVPVGRGKLALIN